MSVRVMAAVWELDLPDSEKLVLLAISDCANDHGAAWPGMKTLVRKCTKSDRTIQAAIKSLVAKGHLSRVERIGKGCEYYVHPVAASGMEGYEPAATHYLYRITCRETGEFYVGARSCYGSPEDDAYMGSGEWIKSIRDQGQHLTKEIIETFPSRGALAVAEQELTKLSRRSPLCRNMRAASARGLANFGGTTPEEISPRNAFAPKGLPLTPEEISGTPEAASGKPSKNRKRTVTHTVRAHELPGDWEPQDFSVGSESRKVVDGWPPGEFPAQLEAFRAHHGKKGDKFIDWQKAWSTWVLNTRRFGIGRNERSSNPTGAALARVQAAIRCEQPFG